MTKPKAERAKQEETKSLRAERRAAERRADRRAEPARSARRTDSDQWNRRLIIGAVVAVILVVIGIIAFGWYQTQIKPLSKTILRVEDTKFSLAHLERRMRLEREENPAFAQRGENLLRLPDFVLGRLELEGALLESADELNITVSEEEVDEEIRERGNLPEDVEAGVFAAEFRRQVEDRGLKQEEYRQMLRAELLREKVNDYFLYLAPNREPQVRARWILLDDEGMAQEVLGRLEVGEDFAALAQEFSLDPETAEEGGELDWAPRGGYLFVPDDVWDFLFAAEPGERSDVITVFDLSYIVELLERDDDRALDEQQRERVANREMGDWIAGLNETLDIERDFTREDAARALDDIL